MTASRNDKLAVAEGFSRCPVAKRTARNTLDWALREASEEVDVDPALVQPDGAEVDDHRNGWSYVTVIAELTEVRAVQTRKGT